MTAASVPPPRRNRVRARLAIGLTISTLLAAALVAVVATVLAGWQADDRGDGTQAGAARVGDEVTVVIVTDEGAQAASQARSDTLRWSLIALAASVLPAVGIGWFIAGRMLGTVDQALADIETTESERLGRLQEVVHELRTPLAVMGTNLELAATDPELDSGTAGFIDAAQRAVGRMGRTVDDLAGHGRLAVTTSDAPVSLEALATEVASEHAGLAQARRLHLFVAGADHTTVPDLDRGALRTAVGNLVGNAVRLAPSGSNIGIGWGETTDWAWIGVTDEGPGIPQHDHARVFERGWRGRHDRDRDDPGTGGLGLTITRQMAEAQGGVVTIESDEGAGSTFAVWLPLNADADQTLVLADDGIHSAVQPWHKGLIGS